MKPGNVVKVEGWVGLEKLLEELSPSFGSLTSSWCIAAMTWLRMWSSHWDQHPSYRGVRAPAGEYLKQHLKQGQIIRSFVLVESLILGLIPWVTLTRIFVLEETLQSEMSDMRRIVDPLKARRGAQIPQKQKCTESLLLKIAAKSLIQNP